jgi:hypothetical protein
MNKEQKEIMKKVNKAFSELYVLSNITWTPYRDVLFKMNRKDEKDHRSGDWSEYHKGSASISDLANLDYISLVNYDLYLEQLENHKKYLRSANDLKGSKKLF